MMIQILFEGTCLQLLGAISCSIEDNIAHPTISPSMVAMSRSSQGPSFFAAKEHLFSRNRSEMVDVPERLELEPQFTLAHSYLYLDHV